MAKKCLAIGINTYPGQPLSGCVNDATDVANFLVSQYGFQEDNIRLLTDDRATKAAIMERLEWLVQCSPGDQIYFHFSGHGTQVACRNSKAEVDGLDEIVCPWDFSWAPEHYITDDEFIAVFSKIPPGVAFCWCSDSCHSGDLSRDMSASFARPKFIRPPADIAWRIRTAKNKSIGSKRSMVGGQLDVGFVSGCMSNQTSADAVINGRPCGAFTYYFLKNLATMKDASLQSVASAVRNDLASNGYDQKPQAEGTRINVPFLASMSQSKKWTCS